MRSFGTVVLCGLGGLALSLAPAAWAQDNVEGPWGIKHGDIFGRARSLTIPALFDANNQPSEVWRLNVQGLGGHRPGGWGSLVFDAAGNLYWRTTLGNNKMMSVTPDGTLRWIAKTAGGADYVFGAGWNSTSPIIGASRVYALGAGNALIAAFDKATGVVIWEAALPGEPAWLDNQQPNPVLYNGKLYVVGQTDGVEVQVHRVDAATGNVDWTSPVFCPFAVSGILTFVPDAFAAGEHGLYFATDSGSGSDGFGEVYGVRVTNTGAFDAWEAEGGKISTGRGGHLIYSPVTGNLYQSTWNDYGATFYVYDPVTGASYNNGATQPAGGHGFYDVSALGWDDVSVVAGGFSGQVGVYTDNQDGTVSPAGLPYTIWFGEYRLVGQLLQNSSGDSILVSGTNSRCNDLGAGHDARVVVLNLDTATGTPEDGPMYVDDVEVLQGPDVNNLTPVFTDNFDALALGDLPGQNNWEDDRASPSGDAGPVQVIVDPTDPNNQVIEVDAAGTGGGWHGAFRNFPNTTGNVVVIRWRQWRADVTDNHWPYFGDFVNDFGAAWTLGWDVNGKYFAYHFEDNMDGTASVLQEAGVWETVQFTYDFINFTVQLTITPEGGTPKVGLPIDQFEFDIAGIGFQLEGTALSSNTNDPDVAYATGVCADHGFTMRGGPLTGPDGKIYYFDGATAELVALGSGCVCAWDLDGDCDTDFQDLVALLAGYGTLYDFQDLVAFLGEYGCQG